MNTDNVTTTKRLRELAGGFAIGLGLGTTALGATIYQHPAIAPEFAGATALIGLFCVALGYTCMREDDDADGSPETADMAETAPDATATA